MTVLFQFEMFENFFVADGARKMMFFYQDMVVSSCFGISSCIFSLLEGSSGRAIALPPVSATLTFLKC